MVRRTAVIAAALLTLSGAAPAQAPWDAWIGCWDLVPRVSSGESPSRVCVLPTASSNAVEMVSVVGDSVTSRRRLESFADQREVRRDDCAGVERVRATGTRVYLRTTLKCGGTGRLVNGVMALSAGGEWLDIQGVAFGSNVGVRAARYRETSASVPLPAEVRTALRGRGRGMTPARIAASGPLQLNDVVEASKELEIGVLQTWLAERGQGFGLDASQLLALEKAGIAPSVIDVMVALSYPHVFALDRTRLGDPPPDVNGDERLIGGRDYGDGFGYGYDPFGYGSGYGYGRGYGWYPGRQPVVVIRQPSGDANDEEHGRVVKGRGYQSGRGDSDRSGSARPSDDSRGRASSGGSSGSGGSDQSTGRKAKPKPGGSN